MNSYGTLFSRPNSGNRNRQYEKYVKTVDASSALNHLQRKDDISGLAKSLTPQDYCKKFYPTGYYFQPNRVPGEIRSNNGFITPNNSSTMSETRIIIF